MSTRNVWMMQGLILAMSATLTASVTMAAPPKAAADDQPTKINEKVYRAKVDKLPVLTIAEPDVKIEELTKVIQDSEKRRPAAAASEAGMSDKLKEIRNQFLSIKTSDELAQLIEKYDKEYDSLPTDAKLLVAQITPARALRGIIFKVRDVFQKRSKAAHSTALTLAKNITTNFRIYLPQDNMKAVHEYFMSPYFVDGKMVDDFDNESDIQTLLAYDFAREIDVANKRLENLNLATPVVWDQQFSYGPGTFEDGLNRFRFVGELEKNLIRSAMMATSASLSVLRAYDINNTIDLSADIGRLYGIDGFITAVDGVSAAKITSQIRRRPNVGAPLQEAGPALTSALNASRWSTIYAKAAWDASATPRQNENLYGIDTGYWRVNRQDVERNLMLAYRVVNSRGAEKIRSSVTGEVIEVNYSGFFDPSRHLQTLLPTKFEKGATVTRQALLSTNDTRKAPLTYRNYSDGSPEGWNLAAYQSFLPSVKKNEDVFRTLRVLSHAGGSWLSVIR